MPYQLGQIKEIVISVKHIDYWIDLFCNYGGWTLIQQSTVDKTILQQYQLSNSITANEALVQFMHVPYGQIRFVQFNGAEQKLMRPSSKIWDTGGIADIDIRTNQIQALFNDLIDKGWHTAFVPNELPAPPFIIEEMLASGPDGVMIAFIQRKQPPLQLPEGKNFPSCIYLSAMTVKDEKQSNRFYVEQLGFKLLNELELQFPKNKPNNFGLPRSLSDCFKGKLFMYSPSGERTTMCETIVFEGIIGEDFSKDCVAPNRGILSMRIEVKGIKDYAQELKSKGVKFYSELNTVTIDDAPALHCMVQSPDGVLIEFVETTE